MGFVGRKQGVLTIVASGCGIGGGSWFGLPVPVDEVDVVDDGDVELGVVGGVVVGVDLADDEGEEGVVEDPQADDDDVSGSPLFCQMSTTVPRAKRCRRWRPQGGGWIGSGFLSG